MCKRRPFFSRCSTKASLAAGLLSAAQIVAAQVGGSAALTSDYVWRGSSQSNGDLAAQAGFRRANTRGWYGAVWASSVEFAPSARVSSELDFTLGWAGHLSSDWSVDVNLTHYRYPGTHVDLDWTEVIGTLTWTQLYWLQAGHSNDALATGASGTYAQVGARFPLRASLRLEAALGQYWLDHGDGDNYAHAQLGAVWAVTAPFELRVTLHDTDAAAQRLFPGLAGARIETALHAAF